MSRRSRKAKVQPTPRPTGFALLKARLPQVLAGLLATGALSGTGGALMSTRDKAAGANERAKAVEVRLDIVERDAGSTARHVQHIDRRTTRIETMLEVLSDQAHVPASKRPPRFIGPDEE